MPHLISDIPQKLRVILSQAANIFLVIVLFYITQYIFNSQFTCSCTPVIHYFVIVYIGLIPIILFFILKLVKQTRTKVCGACCCGICSEIIQILGIGLFWSGFVLLDGDLYLCWATKFNASLVEIPCKTQHTLQENSMITIYKNWSQFWGYILICIGFLVWCLISNTKIGILCEKKRWCEICKIIICCKCLNCKPYYQRRYEELLSEETDKHLDETLQKIAKERAKGICSKHITNIKKSQFSKNSTENSENVDDDWATISKSDFYSSSLREDVNSPSATYIIYFVETED